MRNFITALPIVLLLGFSFVSFMFQFEHLVYFRLALGLFSTVGLFLLYKMKSGFRYFIIYLYASWIVLAAVTAFEEPIFSSCFFGGLVMTMGYLTYMLIYLGLKQDRGPEAV
ncbi:hypothetical protein [Bacillus velezensis]|uniref:hypothetical protein n=1 Tax=Bacillus velezensis TaxID=492670 RepID=UPI002DB9CFF8|nr:hypothetical protein [Bacillus velezensis]MEC2279209.1 hypothetical protein [Bacillus velezensis]